MREAAFSKAEKYAYDQFKIDVITARSVFISAEEAEEKGRVKGEAIGMAKGKAEGKAEIARKLKTRGMPFEQIREITDLSIEEIEKIGQ
jgi:predicted transposase/invertase (TIGR01784 family)